MWFVATILDSTDIDYFHHQNVLLDSTGVEYSSLTYFHSWLVFTHYTLAHISICKGFCWLPGVKLVCHPYNAITLFDVFTVPPLSKRILFLCLPLLLTYTVHKNRDLSDFFTTESPEYRRVPRREEVFKNYILSEIDWVIGDSTDGKLRCLH